MAAPTLTRYSTCFWFTNASFSYYTGLIWSRLNYWYPCLTLESSAHRVLRPLKLPILSSFFLLSFFFFWLFRAHSTLTMRPTDIKTIPIRSTHSDSWSFVLFESFWNTFFQAITKHKVHSIADLAFLFVVNYCISIGVRLWILENSSSSGQFQCFSISKQGRFYINEATLSGHSSME